MQQSTQIDFQIARVVAQRFFGRPLAQSAGLKMMEQPLAKISQQPLEPPADGGLVHMKYAGELGQGLAIEKIGGEQEALFPGKSLQRVGDRASQVSEFRCNRHGSRWRGRRVEGIEWRLTIGPPVMIHMALSERGAQPAEERTAPGVGSEGRAMLSFDLAQAVELGVERVGKIMAYGGGAGDGNGSLGKGSTIEIKEALPGELAA